MNFSDSHLGFDRPGRPSVKAIFDSIAAPICGMLDILKNVRPQGKPTS
jgi:hypothetical protein